MADESHTAKQFIPDAQQFQNVEKYTVTYGGKTDTVTLDTPRTITVTQGVYHDDKPVGYDAGTAMTYEPGAGPTWYDAGLRTDWSLLLVVLAIGAAIGYFVARSRRVT